MLQNLFPIFQFSSKSDINNWRVIDDVVMGGKSSGNFLINKEGYGDYHGIVSLENNGGFSSLRHDFDTVKVENFSKIILRIKGDGKDYQFRIKDKQSNYYSYIYTFSTDKNWQTITIPIKEMYPAFRGRKLNIGNFNADTIEQLAFLIGNKKNEKFQLLIKGIYLK
jgi:hypothetical protein